MPTVVGFRKLARQHLRDARALHKMKRYEGAAYLCGYAVEIALKVRTCKSLGWKDFPDKDHGGRYRSFMIHDLESLLILSGRDDKIRSTPGLAADWSHVKGWNPEMRYELRSGAATAGSVEDMLDATERLLRVLL